MARLTDHANPIFVCMRVQYQRGGPSSPLHQLDEEVHVTDVFLTPNERLQINCVWNSLFFVFRFSVHFPTCGNRLTIRLVVFIRPMSQCWPDEDQTGRRLPSGSFSYMMFVLLSNLIQNIKQ